MSERDIVERLREYIPLASYDGVVLAHVATFKEAADEIERLREALTTIRNLAHGPSYRSGERICAAVDAVLEPKPDRRPK